ncbi:glycosyltransferase [Luminiphilus sp.]|nr:glycosyltransferase [Luminiphilus sp.]
MKVIIPTYKRAQTVVTYITSEELADLTIIDDCSPDVSAFLSESFSEYCRLNNIEVKNNSVNKGLIGNHMSIGREYHDHQLFLINDDDYVSKNDISRLQKIDSCGNARYVLSIFEKKGRGCRKIDYYKIGLCSANRFTRIFSYLFSQHDWLLHGILHGSDLCRFPGFTFFPDAPDMWGRIITFDVLLDGPIKYLPITYQYNGETSKHYKKERRLFKVFAFLIVRISEVHVRYGMLAVRRFHLGSALIIPFALAFSIFALVPRILLAISRRLSKRS